MSVRKFTVLFSKAELMGLLGWVLILGAMSFFAIHFYANPGMTEFQSALLFSAWTISLIFAVPYLAEHAVGEI